DEDLIRVARRDFELARRVPPELVEELAHASSTGHEAWLRAREDSDFALFEPPMRRNVELRRRWIACFPEAERPYDALLDHYEPEMRTARAEDALALLRDGLVPLVEQAAPADDDAILHGGPFPIDAQRRLIATILRQVGAQDRQWRLDDAVHPFAA